MLTNIPKKFDAVAESRKWREASSRQLDAMTREERRAYLEDLSKRHFARLEVQQREAAFTH